LVFLFTIPISIPMKNKLSNMFSQLPNDHNIANIPIVKKQSPSLLVNKAEIELWLAAILVYQKLTNR
jgi:hypothetical protein